MGECRGLWPSDGLLDNDVFRVSYFCDYGIYAGLRGAKKLISLKDEYRELENDGAKLPIDYKYYKGLSFSLQSWRIHGKFLRRWNELSSSFLSSCQKLFNKLSQARGPSSLFMNTTSTDYSLSLIRLTTRFIWNLAMPFNLLERNRN